ncbi:MAG TPA: alpha/beta fold hydrolase, partial [Plasticicumulans sp.]|nr:alpha/beta fold hydrolase [Plasticicumulans sp.]
GERLGTLRLPTLVVSGALDVMTPPKYGRALAEAIPGAHHVEIAGAGHMLALERPQAVRAALTGFLTTLDHAQE